MTSDYERRTAAWAQKAKEEEEAERREEIIVGETTGKVERDIDTAQELKVRINDVESLHLHSSTGLSKGDSVKITIKADPSLSEGRAFNWGREKQSHPDEAYGTVKGKIKKDHEIKIKIDCIDIQKVKSSAELDKGDSVRVVISKT